MSLLPLGASEVLKSAQIDHCRKGSYAVTKEPFGPCPGFRPCEAGFYCDNGQRHSCPAGTYGAAGSLTNSSCSGLCEPGYWCPLESINPRANKCGNVTVYCPHSSSMPLKVPEGYYSVAVDGTDMLDERNLFNEHDENRRSGIVLCPKGWYCPGYSSEPDMKSGRRRRCPAGRYGFSTGLTNEEQCTLCPAGYYCPIGSIEPYQYPCGKDPKVYCPEGSGRRLITEMGYYAVDAIQFVEGVTSSPGAVISTSYSSELGEIAGYSATTICPAGSYCLNGERYACPGGRYGSTKQMTNSSCTGECVEGWYCPTGSVSPYERACGDTTVYCPAGSAAPSTVKPGYYTVSAYANASAAFEMPQGENHLGLRHTKQTICPPGYYCLSDGLAYPCPAGRYGSTEGLTASSCTGACLPGYYCEIASVSADAKKCGSVDYFCREGSAIPLLVQEGYYTVGGEGAKGAYLGTVDTRSSERKCEPGYYCIGGVKSV